MKIKNSKILRLLRETWQDFNEDKCIKLSASLSYYTIFSLPPFLIIIISVCGFFFGKDAVEGKVFGQLRGLVGADAAMQIQNALRNVTFSHNSTIATIAGLIILLISASGIFAEIQDSINFVWRLKAKPKKGFMKFVKNRLMSFSMIGSVGFLLLVGLIANSLLDVLSDRLSQYFSKDIIYLFYLLNIVIIFASITLLFTIIFKTLPDGKVALKDTLIGASFTALLFMIGKILIGYYLGNSTISSVYGTSASVLVVLAWVYYSAIILYFGAEFTKVYAYRYGRKIVPNDYAVNILQKEMGIAPDQKLQA